VPITQVPFPYTFPFTFGALIEIYVEPRYTSIQRVRYRTGLLTTDDLPDDTLRVLIETAEGEIDSWANRDGVKPESWSPTIPPLVIHAATVKASEFALSRMVSDGRLASTESRTGVSATRQGKEGPEYLHAEAEKMWQDYLVTVGAGTPSSRQFGVRPVTDHLHEDEWRSIKRKKKGS
jgi:hypothetical protein